MGISGLTVAGFVAGGLLKGTGEGIQKEAEENRQAALAMYKQAGEIAIKNAEVAGRLQAAGISATARTTAAETAAGGRTEAAKIRSTSEEKIAGMKGDTDLSVANLRGAKFIVQDDGTGGYAFPDGKFKATVNADGTPIATKDKTDKLPAIPATIEYLMKGHGDTPGMSFKDALETATSAKSNPNAQAAVIARLQAAILANDTGPSKDKTGNPIDKAGNAAAKAQKYFQQFTAVTADDDEEDAPAAPAPGILPPTAAGPASGPATPAPPTTPAAPATPGYQPGQTIYLKGVPHIVQPDGKTALPAASPPPAAGP